MRESIRRITLFTGAWCLLATSARAQSMGGMVQRDIRNSIGDVWDVWTSPLRATSRDWLLALGAVAVPAAVSPLDDDVDRWAIRHQGDNTFHLLNPFREGGDAFSGKTVAPLAGGVLLISIISKNQGMQDGVFGCASAYLSNYALRHAIVYPLVNRVRPDSGRGPGAPPAKQGDQYNFSVPGGGSWGELAFPGGHVSNVASCAEFFTRRFDMGVFQVVPWAIVGSVGVARVLDRRHWMSDQVIGLITGYAIGKEVAIRSLRRQAKEPSNPSSGDDDGRGLFVEPAPDGVRLGWRVY